MPNDKLRFDFIDLVFALAIGQVGIELADFFYNKKGSLLSYPYVLSHLALCIYIISASWVGWNVSRKERENKDLKSVFSVGFILLIIDLFIVFFYFIMVKGTDKPWMDNLKNPCLEKHFNGPEAYTETIWSIVIFITYFIWEIFTKLITEWSDLNKPFQKWNKFNKFSYQALLCCAITFVFFLQLKYFTYEKENASKIAIATDIGLFLVFLLFRGLISITKLDDRKDEISEDNNKTGVKIKRSDYFKYIVLPIIGLISILIFNYSNFNNV